MWSQVRAKPEKGLKYLSDVCLIELVHQKVKATLLQNTFTHLDYIYLHEWMVYNGA